MAKRLSSAEAKALRNELANDVNRFPDVFQTATEWHQSGFEGRYTRAQIKRQLEVLAKEGLVKVNRIYPGVYYGPLGDAGEP